MFDPILAYIGPEVLLPLASAVAAVAGGVMVGWRYVTAGFRKVLRFFVRR